MDAVMGLLSALPAQMRDPVLFAIPFFLLLLVTEWAAARRLDFDAENQEYKTCFPRREDSKHAQGQR